MGKESLARIIASIKKGIPVLTINTRLSRYLISEYDNFMRAGGLLSWESPSIMPLGSWMERLWEESGPRSPLLSPVRSKALWEKIIGSDGIVERILLPGGITEAAYQAYSIMKEYGIQFPKDDLYLTEESKALKGWTTVYEDEIKRLGFMERSNLSGILKKTIEEGGVGLPEELILAGFDELTPGVSAFLSGVQKRGVKITFWPYGPEDAIDTSGIKITSRRYENEAEEAVQAARWIRKTLRPNERISIIVPELNRYRDTIAREFACELAPASVLLSESDRDVFNISLGKALSDEPLVRSALEILSIGEAKEDIHKISLLLLSPYLNSGDTLAGIDAGLKKDNCLKAGLYDIKNRLERHGGGKDLARRFDRWISKLKEGRKKAPPGFWAHHFSSLLKEAGWLSGVKLTSKEYQALKAWNSLLESFASLDDVLGKISRSEAAGKAASMANETAHQSETGDSPVQVLGLLEASGQYFDHIWLMGCHEYALPAQPSPNPFIPLYLQKEKGIPHSSHERELAFSRRLLDRILVSAPSITVSSPLETEEKEVRLSPLLRDRVVEEKNPIMNESGRLKDAVHSSGETEEIPDTERIPVSEKELPAIRGGTEVLKNQSLCPFKAFAAHRLNAECIAEPEPGLPPMKRGSILHNAMRLFWEGFKDSDELKKMHEAGLIDEYVNKLTEEVFKKVDVPPPLSSRFMEIEKERLGALIKDWIEVELKRPFFRVKLIESENTIDIKGLKINGRIDRVDSLEDGSEVVIDYKSGKVETGDWFTARPKDPQLLIYAYSGKYEALSFARLSPGDCKFVGISSADGMLPKVKSFDSEKKLKEKAGAEDWESLRSVWRAVLESLANDFISGVAVADPVDESNSEKKTCKNCGFGILCRFNGTNEDTGDDRDNG